MSGRDVPSDDGRQDLVGESLRRAFGTFPTGVVALCGLHAGAPVGMAVSTFVPVSLDPPLVAVCLQRTSRTWPVLRTLPVLGLSVLADRHGAAARSLAARSGDRFAGLETTVTDGGAVHVSGSPAAFVCTLHDEVDAGDHLIALLRVRRVEAEPEIAPLVFHRSGFTRIGSDHELPTARPA